MALPTPPHMGHSWDTCATRDEEQRQIRDRGGSQAKCQGSPHSLQVQPINWTVSSLSKGASRDFSMPAHQRGDYNQLSYTANWYQASLFLREVSEGTKPREVKKNEQRSTNIPECEQGKDHLHPTVSSGKQSPSWSNATPPSSRTESISGIWADLSPSTHGNISSHPTFSSSC